MQPYNKKNTDFNANVAQVWVEEPNFTGYKSLDFTKIDQIEDLLRSGINVSVTGASTINVNVTGGSLNVLNEVEISNTSGNPVPINISEGQSVAVTGTLPSVTIANGQSVAVTGTLPSVTIANGQSVAVTGNVAVTNADIVNLKNNLQGVIFSEENSPSGIVVYQSNLNKDLDNVSVYVSGSLPAVNIAAGQSVAVTGTLPKSQIEYRDVTQSIIQGSDVIRTVSTQYPLPVVLNSEAGNDIYRFSSNIPAASNGTVTISPSSATNAVRKEFFIQNLSAEKLYIKYGTLASSSDFHMILAANTSQDAGDGGALNELNYKGVVSVSGASPRYVVWERFGPI